MVEDFPELRRSFRALMRAQIREAAQIRYEGICALIRGRGLEQLDRRRRLVALLLDGGANASETRRVPNRV